MYASVTVVIHEEVAQEGIFHDHHLLDMFLHQVQAEAISNKTVTKVFIQWHDHDIEDRCMCSIPRQEKEYGNGLHHSKTTDR